MELSKLRAGRSRQFTTFNQRTRDKVARIGTGETATLIDSDGPGLVTRIWFTFNGWFYEHWNPQGEVDPSILKQLILRIYWDGASEPSVEAPMGDFFGIGHAEYRHFTSALLGMSSGGFYCLFPMPFRHMRLTIENRHERFTPHVFMNVNYNETELSEEDARFHCQFTSNFHSGGDPLDVLSVRGRGHFAGLCLSMQGREPNYLSYLEAPEYIYLDGEPEPAIVGTGLEDYIGGGWYFRDGEFCAPYHGVPLKDPLRSMVSLYRFHAQDAVLFQREIRMAFISPWAADRLKPYWHSACAYYYLDGTAQLAPLPKDEVLFGAYRMRDVDHQSIP